MHHKTIRTLSTVTRGGNIGVRTIGVSIGMICSMVAACAGGDTPARTRELEQQIAVAYGNGVGVGSGGASSGGSAGSGSRAGSTGMGGSRAGSGSGGSPSTAGSPATGGNGGSPVGGGGSMGAGDCNGFGILAARCGTSSCHGEGAGLSRFAADEETAASLVGEPSPTCSAGGDLINPDDPPSSLIIRKMDEDPPCGEQMPLTGDPIAPADIECVEDWIGTLQ